MATTRTTAYSVGNTPPQITWTVVKGDTASFRVTVTDDALAPLNLTNFKIRMHIKLEGDTEGTPVLSLVPEVYGDPADGKFTVFLEAAESALLTNGDIFDIELRTNLNATVWTVAQGSMIVIEDITTNTDDWS
jgi:hypothetical protein